MLTRPQHQLHALVSALQSQGHSVYCFPFIEIIPLTTTIEFQTAFQHLPSRIDKIIVTSANALFQNATAIHTIKSTYSKAIWYAIGPGTGAALAEAGITAIIAPAPYHSEQLLELLDFQPPVNDNVLMLTGEGGRPLLAHTLQARGAHLTRLDCYKRQEPHDLFSLETLFKQSLDVVLITSAEGLNAVFERLSLPAKAAFLNTTLVVLSERIAIAADKLGFQYIRISTKADTASMIATITR